MCRYGDTRGKGRVRAASPQAIPQGENAVCDRRPLLHGGTHGTGAGAPDRVQCGRPALPSDDVSGRVLGRPAGPRHRRAAAQGAPAGCVDPRGAARPRLRVRADRRRAGRRSAGGHRVRGRRQLAGRWTWPRRNADDLRAERSWRRRRTTYRTTCGSRRSGPTRRSGSARTSCTRCCCAGCPGSPPTAWPGWSWPAPRRRLAAAVARRTGLARRAARQPEGLPGAAGSPETRATTADAYPGRIADRGIRRRRRRSDSRCPTAGSCSPTCRSGSVRAPRWRWSGRTAPARRRCCGWSRATCRCARARSRGPAGWA